MNQAAASSRCGQVVFDIQLMRRRALAPLDWPLWPAELKRQVLEAEERLKAMSGAEVAHSLIEYGRATGQRVRI